MADEPVSVKCYFDGPSRIDPSMINTSLNETQEANELVQSYVDESAEAINLTAGEPFEKLKLVSFRSQPSEDETLYIVKIDAGSEFVHARILKHKSIDKAMFQFYERNKKKMIQ